MDLFTYQGGRLFAEDVPAADLAERFGTPLYVYSAGTLRMHYAKLADAFAALDPLICYSVKVCSNIHILRLLAEQGSGFDIVSGGELHRVVTAGGDPARCCYAGVAKTEDEIRFALKAGIKMFNVESEQELAVLAALARAHGKPATAALRVNPDVDPRTHRFITTGKKETKFGVDLERAERVWKDLSASDDADGVRLTGVQAHIGSQITTVQPYVQALRRILALVDRLADAGITIATLDFGGGFGAEYEGGEALSATAFAEAMVPLLEDRGLEILMEPGRFIAGNAGILLTQVQYVKPGGDRTFLLCDSGMHHLIRPALYGSYHHIWPVEPGEDFMPRQRTCDEAFPGTTVYDVVGPICESSDFFGKDRHLPPVERGDRLAVFSAGAYGMSMASEYNAFPRPAEVLVDGGEARLIRRRGTYDDLVAPEQDV
ncbi:MAG: diaminopimelate decarboxylase [Phycisphaerae bacterium]